MTLSANEIHLFACYPDQISDPDLLRQYAALLSNQEANKLPAFYHQKHRHQYLVTRALQRHCLSIFSQTPPREWRFEAGQYGKPAISYPKHQHHVSFNLSHTDGLVVCAMTRDAELGVDVENQQRKTQATYEQLSSYFSTAEIAQLQQLPAEKLKRRFFEHWTLKEAYIKARGAGFAIPLGQFGFLFEDNHPESFFTDPSLHDKADDWQFWQASFTSQYTIALALRSRNPGIRLITHQCIPLQSTQINDQLEFSHLEPQ